MKNLLSKLIFFLVIIFFVSSCSVTKKLSDDEYYLKSNKYKFEGNSPFSGDLNDYVSQKPNKKTLGFIPIKDWTYNEVDFTYDSVFQDYYSYPVKERNQTLLDSLYIRYSLEDELGKGKWLLRQLYRAGAKPIVLDTAKTVNSASQLKKLYFSRGYFDAEVSPKYKIDSSKQKAQVTFNVDVKEPSKIVEYNQVIQDANLERLYEENIEDIKVKENERFDVRNFEAERDRLSKIFKNNGYYKFNELGQELIFKIDSTEDKELRTTLKIAKPKQDSVKSFKQYYLGNIEVMLDDDSKDAYPYTVNHRGYELKSSTPFHLKPRVFTDAVSIKSGEMYRLDDMFKTRELILDRENFSLISFTTDYSEGNDSILNAKIKLRPKDKYDLELSFEAMYSELLQFGISPGLRFLTRDIFKGGENLEFNLRGNIGTVSREGENNSFFNAYELSFETKMNFPRWVLPFNTEELVPKEWNPKSSISVGLSGQKNIGLGSRSYSAIMDYSWKPNISSHKFDLVNFQYIKNTEVDKYYNIFIVARGIRNDAFSAYFNYSPDVETLYNNGEITEDQLEYLVYGDLQFSDSLPNNGYSFKDYTDYRNMIFTKSNITQNMVIQSFSHTYSYNQKLRKDKKHPWSLYAKGELSGALLRLLDKTIGFETRTDVFGDQQSLVGGVPYSEFVRFDLDIRKTIDLGKKSQLAFRSFTGVAIPYGNLQVLPFTKSYFSGGSNDVRAWAAYGLSPAPLRPGDGGTYVDQMKITWNGEYRFPLTGMVNGALFVDAGNIWSLNDNTPSTKFKFNKFLSQMGVGAGFGLRLDFTFVVVRVDAGYKVHNPAYEEGDRWFRNVKLLSPRIHFGINYPF